MNKKISKKNIFFGIAYIQSTFNNTIITITDLQGNTISNASAGSVGFKGSRRSTSYAAQAAADKAGRIAMEHGVRSIKVIIKGLGDGRTSSIKSLNSMGLTITLIQDVTPVPHNGCRSPKKRRV